MSRHKEGLRTFNFPKNWKIWKYDGSDFHKKDINSLGQKGAGYDGIDFVAFRQNGDALWLIEVKDCIGAQENTVLATIEAMRAKVLDSLFGLALACHYNNISLEWKNFSKEALSKNTLNVVLHIEMPQNYLLLKKFRVNAKNKLLQQLCFLPEKNLHLASKDNMGQLEWRVA